MSNSEECRSCNPDSRLTDALHRSYITHTLHVYIYIYISMNTTWHYGSSLTNVAETQTSRVNPSRYTNSHTHVKKHRITSLTQWTISDDLPRLCRLRRNNNQMKHKLFPFNTKTVGLPPNHYLRAAGCSARPSPPPGFTLFAEMGFCWSCMFCNCYFRCRRAIITLSRHQGVHMWWKYI